MPRRGGLAGRLAARSRSGMHIIQRYPAPPEMEDDIDKATIATVTQALSELREVGTDDELGRAVLALVIVAAQISAPAAASAARFPATVDLQDVASYLVAAYRDIALHIDPAHFNAWLASGDRQRS